MFRPSVDVSAGDVSSKRQHMNLFVTSITLSYQYRDLFAISIPDVYQMIIESTT